MKVSIIPWIVRKLKLCFALVEDGDTASQNIAQGKFVIWKGVCCKAASAITAGETLSGTNLPAISDGALNNIGSDISTLNSKIATNTDKGTVSSKAGLDAILEAILGSMQSDGIEVFKVVTNSAFDVFTNSAVYVGTIYKSSTGVTYSHVDFRKIGSSDEVVGYRNGNGWKYESINGKSFDTSCSYNTSVVGSGSPRYHRYGNVVVVSLDFTLSSAVSTSGTAIITNLPEAGGAVWLSITGYSDNKSYRVRVVGTEITTYYSNTLPAQTYNGFVMYIAK